MKKIYLLLFFGFIFLISSCQAPDDDIYILYDNDVHCAIDGYEKMAALRAEYLEKSLYVNVISCGDFSQGNAIGCISNGKYPAAIMNKIPYDYVTLGNHEFDYGMPHIKKIRWWLNAKCLCCNLTYVPTGENLFKPYDIRTYGTTKVAYVGVATPTTLTTSMPTNFQDENGNVVYDFYANNLPNVVQQSVNAAREEGAEYVIVLSHLGDDTKGVGVNSIELIEQTTGINAVLDGHAHHVLNMKVANADGDSILLASTGTNFHYVGRLLIAQDHTIQNELIDLSAYQGHNERILSKINSIKQSVAEKTNYEVGYSQIKLIDSDIDGTRLVRSQETNLGDFVTDAFRTIAKADIGVAIGGGLRGDIASGKVMYSSLLEALPFNNSLCKVNVTGAQLLDNLEIAVRNYPKESGDFMHVSGLHYTFDPSIPSPVYINKDGQLDSIGGDRRITFAEVYQESGWVPVDTNATYTIGGQNYVLLCGGSEGVLFQDAKPVEINEALDVDVVRMYLKLLGDTIRQSSYGKTKNRIRILE